MLAKFPVRVVVRVPRHRGRCGEDFLGLPGTCAIRWVFGSRFIVVSDGQDAAKTANIADRQQIPQTSRSMKNRVRQAKGRNASPNSFGRTHFRSSCSDPKGGRIWLELAGGVRRRLRLA